MKHLHSGFRPGRFRARRCQGALIQSVTHRLTTARASAQTPHATSTPTTIARGETADDSIDRFNHHQPPRSGLVQQPVQRRALRAAADAEC
jgi:hypothetical protein